MGIGKKMKLTPSTAHQFMLTLFVLGSFHAVQAENILFIGDSHSVGHFGHDLDQELRKIPGAAVTTQASCGSVAGSWFPPTYQSPCGGFVKNAIGFTSMDSTQPPYKKTFKTPSIAASLASVKPKWTIVALGTNYGPWADVTPEQELKIVNDMEKMADAIVASGSGCIWVGLPKTERYSKTQAHIYELTKLAISKKCKPIDSLLLTEFPKHCDPDMGLHYNCDKGMIVAQSWANQVASQARGFMGCPLPQ